MKTDKARAVLEQNFGEFNVDVQALYTLLLAAEERFRDLERMLLLAAKDLLAAEERIRDLERILHTEGGRQ
jgi:hypothetical protein